MRAIRLTILGCVVSLAAVMTAHSAETKTPAGAPRATADATVRAGEKKPTAAAEAPDGKPRETATAVFAGGCFWCTEYAFEQLAGVIDVESGYCGGTKATANYDRVHLGTTAHAEAIKVTYDPKTITYDDLLDVFFDAHNPTQLNRQGENDIGRQYRSAIFFANEEQKKQAEAKIADLEAKKVFKKRIVTKLEPLKEFFPAESYHQDFARRNPLLPYIQTHSLPKAMEVRAKHPQLLRTPE